MYVVLLLKTHVAPPQFITNCSMRFVLLCTGVAGSASLRMRQLVARVPRLTKAAETTFTVHFPTTEFVRANRLTEIIFLLLEERLKLCLMLPLFHSIADTQTYNSKLIIQFNSFSECSGASSGTSHKHVSSQIQASLPPTVFSESLELGDVCGEVFRMTESVSYLVQASSAMLFLLCLSIFPY